MYSNCVETTKDIEEEKKIEGKDQINDKRLFHIYMYMYVFIFNYGFYDLNNITSNRYEKTKK